MKYYLETNALYQIRNLPKEILKQSFTSSFSILEIIAGINEKNYLKRRSILSEVLKVQLNVEWTLPEELIYRSFDINLEQGDFIEERTKPLQELLAKLMQEDSFTKYSSSIEYNNPNYGNEFFKSLDENMTKSFYSATVNGIKQVKTLLGDNKISNTITIAGNTYNFQKLKDLGQFLFDYKAINEVFTINSLASFFEPSKQELVEKEIIKSYNCTVDVFVKTFSLYCADQYLIGSSPAKNDFQDLFHLFYLKDGIDCYIVSSDNIFKRYLKENHLEISKVNSSKS